MIWYDVLYSVWCLNMIKCECTILNIFNFFNALCEAPVSHSGSLRPDQPRKNGRRSSGAGIMFLTEAGVDGDFKMSFVIFLYALRFMLKYVLLELSFCIVFMYYWICTIGFWLIFLCDWWDLFWILVGFWCIYVLVFDGHFDVIFYVFFLMDFDWVLMDL